MHEVVRPRSSTLLDSRSGAERGLLRFLTCGSVDDGKSTLIGRLLYDCKLIYADQLKALEKDSARYGTTGGQIDMALLVDGLQAEREQGITIDVAYRFFSSQRRSFIVADTPGHEQYTRNMATGASTADVAVLLVDARKGLLTQTFRHSYIVSLLGIRNIVLAVNKMDLVDWDRATFDAISSGYRAFAAQLGLSNIVAIPVSALTGDNVTQRSETTGWYAGPTLLEYLETVDVASDASSRPFRMAIQWVNRPNQDFRGYAGTIAGGRVRPGDRVVVLPSGRVTTIGRIVTYDGDLAEAAAGRAVTLTLSDDIDASRGDMIAANIDRPTLSDQFAAYIVWMNEAQMLPERSYLLAMNGNFINAQITKLKHKVNVNTLEHVAAKHLDLNEVALVNIAIDRPVAFDPYDDNRETGGFVLIDRLSNATVGCGMIRFALRRSTNIHWQPTRIDKTARAALKGQKPCVLWFTGLSGAGKSTIADLVEQALARQGRHTIILDGDNIRHGLNKDLGFTDEDRVENIRRIAEVARLMVQAGLIVLVSFISPFRSERRMARGMVGLDEFLEIFVDTPLDVCEARDPKGLYKLARSGKLPNMTGIGSAYEPPEHAELVLAASTKTPEALADEVLAELKRKSII
ncbi:MAG: Sulfate adenylyltransferase subunit 1 / Adenylylsulfate kinase [Pseudolabrys sp.]|jgi:bifunctional enzyme CysN/CysC|nr:Sulfate adenylyltransferase subunit 1 / Adenylylsulfate kinase [Pseudolabrys sp.]